MSEAIDALVNKAFLDFSDDEEEMEESEEEVHEEAISDKQPVFEETKESKEYIDETVPTAHIETEVSRFQDEREPEK